MSEEDVTISKQTFMVVIYPPEDLGAKSFVTWSLVMTYFFWEISPNVLRVGPNDRLLYLQFNSSYFQIRKTLVKKSEKISLKFSF